MKTIYYVPGKSYFINLAPFSNPDTLCKISDEDWDDESKPTSQIYWYIQYPTDHFIEFHDLEACLSTDQSPKLPVGALSARGFRGQTRIYSLATRCEIKDLC